MFHLPLGVNAKRSCNRAEGVRELSETQHDITFIGNLYNDGKNLFDSIHCLPDTDRRALQICVYRDFRRIYLDA